MKKTSLKLSITIGLFLLILSPTYSQILPPEGHYYAKGVHREVVHEKDTRGNNSFSLSGMTGEYKEDILSFLQRPVTVKGRERFPIGFIDSCFSVYNYNNTLFLCHALYMSDISKIVRYKVIKGEVTLIEVLGTDKKAMRKYVVPMDKIMSYIKRFEESVPAKESILLENLASAELEKKMGQGKETFLPKAAMVNAKLEAQYLKRLNQYLEDLKKTDKKYFKVVIIEKNWEYERHRYTDRKLSRYKLIVAVSKHKDGYCEFIKVGIGQNTKDNGKTYGGLVVKRTVDGPNPIACENVK